MTKQSGSAYTLREPPALAGYLSNLNATGDLLDINVWLALALEEHPHHLAAKNYWKSEQSLTNKFMFCRVTMLGFVRLLCQPKVVGNGALQLGSAFALYQSFRASSAVGFVGEPKDCEAYLSDALELTGGNPLPTHRWTDAYLAALSQSSNTRLVTFDHDFIQFGLERLLILSEQR